MQGIEVSSFAVPHAQNHNNCKHYSRQKKPRYPDFFPHYVIKVERKKKNINIEISEQRTNIENGGEYEPQEEDE